MNGKRLQITLLSVLLAVSITAPSVYAADAPDTSKKMEQAVAAVKQAPANEKGLAAQKAKIAVDGIKERVKKFEDSVNDEWSDLNQFARQSAEATLNKLHEQRDRLVESYQQLAKSSDAEWESAKQSFLRDYDKLHQTLSDAEMGF